MKIKTVKSADGTAIAFESAGNGPPLILVGGAFCDRRTPTSGTPLAALIEGHTVISYDRRGRGESGDTAPWSIDREAEDLAALIAECGGSAAVFGNSSGGLLALEAAVRGLPIGKLVVYEPPVILDPARAEAFKGLAARLAEDAAAGRRAEAVEAYFTQVMQMPRPAVDQMRRSPMWPGLEALAHTLSHDLALTARGPARLADMPRVRSETLVLDGSASPAWMRGSLQALAGAIPGARHRTLEGQTHAVDPKALAQAIGAFLAG